VTLVRTPQFTNIGVLMESLPTPRRSRSHSSSSSSSHPVGSDCELESGDGNPQGTSFTGSGGSTEQTAESNAFAEEDPRGRRQKQFKGRHIQMISLGKNSAFLTYKRRCCYRHGIILRIWGRFVFWGADFNVPWISVDGYCFVLCLGISPNILQNVYK
jgi:hypothetical protein